MVVDAEQAEQAGLIGRLHGDSFVADSQANGDRTFDDDTRVGGQRNQEQRNRTPSSC
jgi:hypothetical protein